MTTIEITEDLIENLVEGARQFGRCSTIAETTDGERVFLVLTDNHRRGRPRRKDAQQGYQAASANAPGNAQRDEPA